MLNLTPFILFDGNCAEAMSFYQKCFGGELTITTLGDSPMKFQVPKEQHHKVVNAYLESKTVEFSATDWLHPTRKFRQGNSVAMYLKGGTYDELKEIFDKLSDGADKNLLDELREMPFGIYGHLADKYGVHWFFVGEK
ncbi:MAG TPA: VOC family protein [Chitinophagaceae bacterium]